MLNGYAEFRQRLIKLQDERDEKIVDFDALEQIWKELREAQIWDLFGYCTYKLHSYWGVANRQTEKAKMYLEELEALRDDTSGSSIAYKLICESELQLVVYQKPFEAIKSLVALKAYRAYHKITDEFVQFMELYLCGNSYRTIDQLEKAQQYFFDCTILTVDNLYIYQMIMAHYMHGIVSHELKQDENAMKSYAKCLSLSKQFGNALRVAHSETAVAGLYYNYQCFDKALEMYHNSLTVFEASGQQQLMRRVYTQLGLVYTEIKNLDKAEEFYIKALKIYEKFELISGHTFTLIQLGKVYLQKDLLDKAKQCIKEAKELIKNHTQRNICKVTLKTTMAELYMKTKKYSSAERCLNAATRLNNKKSDEGGLADIYKLYSDLYAQKGDFQKAYEYHTKYHLLTDKISKEDKKVQIETLLKKIESDNLQDELRAKLEKERYEAVLAMVVTANHDINQPLTVAKLNLNMVMLNKHTQLLNKKQIKWLTKIEDALSQIEYTLTKYRKNDVFNFSNYLPHTNMVRFGNNADLDKWTVE